MNRTLSSSVVVLALVLPALAATPAHANLILTPAGVADGFHLSTFVSGFSPDSAGVGPLGIAFPGNGTVLVGDSAGNIRVFPSDTDGQSAGAGRIVTSLGFNSQSTGTSGMTQINGSVYLANELAGTILRLNADGTVNSTVTSGFDRPTGLDR